MESVTILWGKYDRHQQTYDFNTLEELNAFLLGISEGEGWEDWEQVDPDNVEAT